MLHRMILIVKLIAYFWKATLSIPQTLLAVVLQSEFKGNVTLALCRTYCLVPAAKLSSDEGTQGTVCWTITWAARSCRSRCILVDYLVLNESWIKIVPRSDVMCLFSINGVLNWAQCFRFLTVVFNMNSVWCYYVVSRPLSPQWVYWFRIYLSPSYARTTPSVPVPQTNAEKIPSKTNRLVASQNSCWRF